MVGRIRFTDAVQTPLCVQGDPSWYSPWKARPISPHATTPSLDDDLRRTVARREAPSGAHRPVSRPTGHRRLRGAGESGHTAPMNSRSWALVVATLLVAAIVFVPLATNHGGSIVEVIDGWQLLIAGVIGFAGLV